MFSIDCACNKNCKTLIIYFIFHVIIPNVNGCNGFDFEYIESFIFLNIWIQHLVVKIYLIKKIHHVVNNMHHAMLRHAKL
jgi:hypothetical protein